MIELWIGLILILTANVLLYLALTKKMQTPPQMDPNKLPIPTPIIEREVADMKVCYEAIKKARAVRWKPIERRDDYPAYTNISREMWDILQPVIEVPQSKEWTDD